jgi:hypothetical protein
MVGVSTVGVLGLRRVLRGWGGMGFIIMRVRRRVGVAVVSRDAASCCKSLGQQGRAVGPLQDGRAPGIIVFDSNGISMGRGRDPGGLSGQGSGAGSVLLPCRGCLWQWWWWYRRDGPFSLCCRCWRTRRRRWRWTWRSERGIASASACVCACACGPDGTHRCSVCGCGIFGVKRQVGHGQNNIWRRMEGCAAGVVVCWVLGNGT